MDYLKMKQPEKRFNMNNIPIKELFDIALAAGQQIMKVYSGEIEVEQKEDNSPLTLADKLAHNVIVERLRQLNPSVPILSEEGATVPYEERKLWEAFWIVDPLDGTKEFIKKNDEFTVNIAYIQNGSPQFGVIYAPALDTYYFGFTQLGAFKLEQASQHTFTNANDLLEACGKIEISKLDGNTVRVVASRSHLSKETEQFISNLESQYEHVEVTSAGSSLKFCLVAEGNAHFYPRYAPTMEWDTAAGQAIVEAAGGSVIDYVTNEIKVYNQENLLNDWFLVQGKNEK